MPNKSTTGAKSGKGLYTHHKLNNMEDGIYVER